jgi:hypothetical protein
MNPGGFTSDDESGTFPPEEIETMFGADFIPPFPPEIDRARFGDWLTGFTDGKGLFELEMRIVGEQEVPTAWFQIAVRADDEKLLTLIMSYLSVGRIYRQKASAYDRGATVPLLSIYCVEDSDDLHNEIVPHFEAHPLLRMQEEFATWRKYVELIYRVEHGEPDDE